MELARERKPVGVTQAPVHQGEREGFSGPRAPFREAERVGGAVGAGDLEPQAGEVPPNTSMARGFHAPAVPSLPPPATAWQRGSAPRLGAGSAQKNKLTALPQLAGQVQLPAHQFDEVLVITKPRPVPP